MDFHMKKLKKILRQLGHWLAYEPPGSLSAKDWRLFNDEFEEKAPIRWYIHHEFSRDYIWPVKKKFSDIKWWILHRTTRRFHIVNTGLPPGYNEFETRMLHVNFTMLVDFVEVEQAMHYWFGDPETPTVWEKYVPFYRVFKPYRNPTKGIKYNEWSSTLDDPSLPPAERSPHQAETSRETLELYHWWKTVRPARSKKPLGTYSDQGLDLFSALDEDFDPTAQDYVDYQLSRAEEEKLEAAWDEEDTTMLIRLIKIRRSLWT